MSIITSLSSARIEVCSFCQLRCPLCPTFLGETTPVVGKGRLKARDFERFLQHNPTIRSVELGNFGEVFLNTDLPEILRIAYERGVTTEIDEGANLNDASDQALEALVRYQVAVMRCAIDGATQKSYEQYRVGGNLKKVLGNIQKIQSWKKEYHSSRPHLIYQFVIFSHNEHETEQARLLAEILGMEIYYKLNFFPKSRPVQDRDKVRRLVGYADRYEYLEQNRTHYKRSQCYEMWLKPQVNWDGKLLGCSRNFWGIYSDNVLEGDLLQEVNNEKMSYARAMLMGLQPPRQDMPCMHCGVFTSMRRKGTYITQEEIAAEEKALLERL